VEVNIHKDGSLDLENNILKDLDVVGAAIHSHFSLPKKEQSFFNIHFDIVIVISHHHPYMILSVRMVS
jgi:histidinol phosphatase-like PHP family hydrolase